MEPVLDRQRGSRLLVPLSSGKNPLNTRAGHGCAPARTTRVSRYAQASKNKSQSSP